MIRKCFKTKTILAFLLISNTALCITSYEHRETHKWYLGGSLDFAAEAQGGFFLSPTFSAELALGVRLPEFLNVDKVESSAAVRGRFYSGNSFYHLGALSHVTLSQRQSIKTDADQESMACVGYGFGNKWLYDSGSYLDIQWLRVRFCRGEQSKSNFFPLKISVGYYFGYTPNQSQSN